MKHPVLHVRKGVEVYDDNRSLETPLAPAAAGREPPRRRRRRGRVPIFLPLVIVVLALAVVLRLAPARDTVRFPGWAARLGASPSGATLLVTVAFTAGAGTAASVRPSANVLVFLPDTGATCEISGTLTPPSTTLQGTIPLTAAVKKLQADIAIGEEHRPLSMSVGARR